MNGYEIASGALPGAAGGGLVIHVVMAAIFAIPLFRTPARP